MFEKIIDEFDKQDGNMKALFANQDAEIYRKIETQIQSLKLQVKDNSETLSSMKSSYDERLDRIRNNNKTSTKFDTARKENEETPKKRFDELKVETTRFS